MGQETSVKPFKGFNHGKDQITIKSDDFRIMGFAKPVEIHLKEDGSVKDEPSFAIVMVDQYKEALIGQISLEMFNDGLADIGYQIIKKE